MPFYSILFNVTNTGSYLWSLPYDVEPRTNIRVNIEVTDDTSINSQSPPFAILGPCLDLFCGLWLALTLLYALMHVFLPVLLPAARATQLTCVAPVGGEVFQEGRALNVEWQSLGAFAEIRLDLLQRDSDNEFASVFVIDPA